MVSPVNYNSPGQVVIAGEKAAVERAAAACKAAGAKMAVALPVSVPSHCALMKPAADKLASALGNIEFSQPQIPVINNADVAQPQAAADIVMPWYVSYTARCAGLKPLKPWRPWGSLSSMKWVRVKS